MMVLVKDVEEDSWVMSNGYMSKNLKVKQLRHLVDCMKIQDFANSEVSTDLPKNAEEEETEEIGADEETKFLEHLSAQSDAIKSMAEIVDNLTDRVNDLGPRIQEAPAALRMLAVDVGGLKSRLDKLVMAA